MSEDIPTFRLEIKSCGAPHTETTKWCDNLSKTSKGDPMIYVPDTDRLAMFTTTLKPCGYIVNSDLLRYIEEGVEFSATRDTIVQKAISIGYEVEIHVIFRPVPPQREQESTHTRESIDA